MHNKSLLLTTTLQRETYSDPALWKVYSPETIQFPLPKDKIDPKVLYCEQNNKLFSVLRLTKAFKNKDGDRLFTIIKTGHCTKNLMAYEKIENVAGLSKPDDARMFAILVKENKFILIDHETSLVDAGDFDGDGESELVFLDESDPEGVRSIILYDSDGRSILYSTNVSRQDH